MTRMPLNSFDFFFPSRIRHRDVVREQFNAKISIRVVPQVIALLQYLASHRGVAFGHTHGDLAKPATMLVD